jgi:transposase-like protein
VPIKRVICPERVRSVPAQFSWVDHRLVRDRHIERCDVHAAALYLFLVTVADAQGLSYYSDTAVARRLSIQQSRLAQARNDLIQLELIAYEQPLYQVLALEALAPRDRPELDSGEARARLNQLRQLLSKRMISYEMYCKIRDCRDRQRLTISQTARVLGLHRGTVAKWLATAQYRRRASPPRASRLDPFKAQVVRLVETHPYSAQQIFQQLREAGFIGGLTIVRDYVRKVRPPRRRAFLKLTFAPGE